MEVCEVCGRKFKSGRGLKYHIARAHKTPKALRSLYTKTASEFYPLLEERKWLDAERFLREVKREGIEEEWMRGYIQALEGMLLALRMGPSSPPPHVLEVIGYDKSQLTDAKKGFNRLLRMPMKTEYDAGYFQAWFNYIDHLLNKA